MVAVGDFGNAQRERMVTLATEHGWIQNVVGWAAEREHVRAVAVLATLDAKPPGALGKIVSTVARWLKSPQTRRTRRIQRTAGLNPYMVFPVPLDALCQVVDNNLADDLREAAARNQYVVLCVNADEMVSVAGVTRDEPEADE